MSIKYYIRCSASDIRTSTGALSIHQAEKIALSEGFIMFKGKWYQKKFAPKGAENDNSCRYGNHGLEGGVPRNSPVEPDLCDPGLSSGQVNPAV